MTTEEAVKKINKVHGDKYKLPDGWKYVNAKTDIELSCSEHGVFHKDFYRLVNKRQGCPVCSLGKVYKHSGFWNSLDNCINEAKKYRNKYELERHCNSCYNGFIRNGWKDKLDNLYDKTIIYNDYNNPNHLIYVYEFEKQKTFYVGRTTCLKRRHKQHINGYWTRKKIYEYDSIYRFAQENNIAIPDPIVLENGLTALESQEREDFWKSDYIKRGWTTLNKAPTGINVGSLGAGLKWTHEACKEEAKKYNSKYEMKTKCQPAYSSAVRNGWIDEFFEDKKKKDGYWDNLENVLNAAKQCSGARDLIKRFGGAYNKAKKHNWLELLEYGKK